MADGTSIKPSSLGEVVVSGSGRRYPVTALRRAARHEAGHAVMSFIAARAERRPDWEPIQVFINHIAHPELQRGASVREHYIWGANDLPKTFRYKDINNQSLAEVVRGMEWELLISLAGIAADIEIGGMRPMRAVMSGGTDDYQKAASVLSDINALQLSGSTLEWYERRTREIIKRERRAVEGLASALLAMRHILQPDIGNIVHPLLQRLR